MDEEHERVMHLWSAVFVLGIRDYAAERKAIARHGGRFGEPTNWFECDRREHPGSFMWLCDLFGYKPSYVRNHVLMNLRKLAKDDRDFETNVVPRYPRKRDRASGESISTGDRTDSSGNSGKVVPHGWGEEPDDDVLGDTIPEEIYLPEEARSTAD